MSTEKSIKCPNCGFDIDINDAMSHQLEESIKRKYAEQLAQEKKKFDSEFELLNKQKADFEQNKKRENELFKERLDAKVKEEKELLEKKLKHELLTENDEALKRLNKELEEKSNQVREFNRFKADFEALKREKEELKEKFEAEKQIELSQKLNEEKEKIRKQEQEKNELAFKELHKQLEDQKKLTDEMRRKQEQGSMQLQGEVQELAIEEYLKSNFPLDTIEEIKKGARGADCVQIVNTRNMANCGTIYYESKRTKDFQATWIEKFKADIREKNANMGVLVTDVLPSGMDRMGLKDGIWICTFEEFKGLCNVLRESIIQLSAALVSQENKGDKMQMLYDYLTSNNFRLQIEAIVEGFTQMKHDLDKEKNAMQRIWKTREKQIEKVLINTINMHGSIKGIAGSAVGEIKALELGSDDFNLDANE
jgi:hypothetical protein